MKFEDIKNELINVRNKNNENVFFKIYMQTIITSTFLLYDKKDLLNDLNKNERIGILVNDSRHLTLDVQVNSDDLMKEWNNPNRLFFDEQNIIKKYVSLKNDSDFNNFITKYKLSRYLYMNGLVTKPFLYISNAWTYKIEPNDFNSNSLNKDWVAEFDSIENDTNKIGWWLDKTILEREIISNNISWHMKSELSTSDNLVMELLFKGNHSIRIDYREVDIELTEKGINFLETGWWRKNWQWFIGVIVTFIISVLISLLLHFL